MSTSNRNIYVAHSNKLIFATVLCTNSQTKDSSLLFLHNEIISCQPCSQPTWSDFNWDWSNDRNKSVKKDLSDVSLWHDLSTFNNFILKDLNLPQRLKNVIFFLQHHTCMCLRRSSTLFVKIFIQIRKSSSNLHPTYVSKFVFVTSNRKVINNKFITRNWFITVFFCDT